MELIIGILICIISLIAFLMAANEIDKGYGYSILCPFVFIMSFLSLIMGAFMICGEISNDEIETQRQIELIENKN